MWRKGGRPPQRARALRPAQACGGHFVRGHVVAPGLPVSSLVPEHILQGADAAASESPWLGPWPSPPWQEKTGPGRHEPV